MKNVPDIRFKGFENEWESLVVSDCLQVNKSMNTDNSYGREDVLSVSDEYGIVNQIKYLGRSYAGKSVLKYKVVKPNQIVYTKSPLKDKPYGIVKQSEIYGIVSSLYAVYDIIDNCIPSYIQWYYEPYYRINKYFRPLVNKGAKNTINISDTNAVTGKIYFPKIEEQKIISSYLEILSNHINETAKKIASLKQLKSASLISMFPQQGETVPRVRFKGFDGEWKKKKLSECLEISNDINADNYYGRNEVLSVSDEVGVVNQIKLLGRSYAGKSVSKYKIFRPNQIVYTKSPLKDKPYGIIKENCGETGIVSVLYAVYSTKEHVVPSYIHYYFEPKFRINKYLYPLVNKGAKNTMNISDEAALEGYINIPSSEDEQHQIASYFRQLDIQISEQEKRLEKLKQIKAACLDKMFV